MQPMSRYRRCLIPGATYFFTITLSDRSSSLLVNEIDRFRTAYRQVVSRLPVDTIAICVMPDHVHAIWTLPPDDTDSETAEPLLILLRRFATESAREEARLFCDELIADEAVAAMQHDLIAA